MPMPDAISRRQNIQDFDIGCLEDAEGFGRSEGVTLKDRTGHFGKGRGGGSG